MTSEEYPNECGTVVGGLTRGELGTLIENLDDKELRIEFLRLLMAMYESNVDVIHLVYPPVRGKQ